MTADQTKRPNINQLCQLMVDVLMAQLDFIREKEQMNHQEINHLKERVKNLEAPTITGFNNFNGDTSSMVVGTGNTLNRTNNGFANIPVNNANNSILRSPISNIGGGFIKPNPHTGFTNG